jgi:hypothetical protein
MKVSVVSANIYGAGSEEFPFSCYGKWPKLKAVQEKFQKMIISCILRKMIDTIFF